MRGPAGPRRWRRASWEQVTPHGRRQGQALKGLAFDMPTVAGTSSVQPRSVVWPSHVQGVPPRLLPRGTGSTSYGCSHITATDVHGHAFLARRVSRDTDDHLHSPPTLDPQGPYS